MIYNETITAKRQACKLQIQNLPPSCCSWVHEYLRHKFTAGMSYLLLLPKTEGEATTQSYDTQGVALHLKKPICILQDETENPASPPLSLLAPNQFPRDTCFIYFF